MRTPREEFASRIESAGEPRFRSVSDPIVGEDAVDPLPHHTQEWLLDKLGIAHVVESVGELLGATDLLIELADGQEPGVAGQRRGGDLDLKRSRWEEIE